MNTPSRITELREQIAAKRLEKAGLTKQLADSSLAQARREQAGRHRKVIVGELKKMADELENAIDAAKRALEGKR